MKELTTEDLEQISGGANTSSMPNNRGNRITVNAAPNYLGETVYVEKNGEYCAGVLMKCYDKSTGCFETAKCYTVKITAQGTRTDVCEVGNNQDFFASSNNLYECCAITLQC